MKAQAKRAWGVWGIFPPRRERHKEARAERALGPWGVGALPPGKNVTRRPERNEPRGSVGSPPRKERHTKARA